MWKWTGRKRKRGRWAAGATALLLCGSLLAANAGETALAAPLPSTGTARAIPLPPGERVVASSVPSTGTARAVPLPPGNQEGTKGPELFAQSAVLIDGETGRVLFGKNEEETRPMASTTKIMTCILALENASPGDVVEVSDYAASMPDVQLNIRRGETYYLKDLLYSMMLESHNDSAVAIAEHVAGSREKFADMMNQKARDIGCASTHFITPNGLDASVEETGEIHSTTAKDLAEILRYCINRSPKKEEFLEITRTPSHSFSNIEKTRSFSCVNHNALLTSMAGAVSGKTGFTGGAGYCYVGAVEKDGRTFIAALLACGWPPHKTYKWQDMNKIIGYGDKNYDFRDILRQDVALEPAEVKNGVEEEVGLGVLYPEEKALRVLMREDEPVRLVKKVLREMTAPVAIGQEAGSLDYYVGDDLVASYPICAAESAREWNLKFCVKSLLKRFLI